MTHELLIKARYHKTSSFSAMVRFDIEAAAHLTTDYRSGKFFFDIYGKKNRGFE